MAKRLTPKTVAELVSGSMAQRCRLRFGSWMLKQVQHDEVVGRYVAERDKRQSLHQWVLMFLLI